jgi:hypothetical protein
MAIHSELKDLAIDATDEYLTAAKACVQARKPADGGILGYPAMLLLFCVTDAIGHSPILKVKGGDVRLGVLKHPIFGLNLTDKQIGNLKQMYRNRLAHNGLLTPGV